jgi:hypothetical protein
VPPARVERAISCSRAPSLLTRRLTVRISLQVDARGRRGVDGAGAGRVATEGRVSSHTTPCPNPAHLALVGAGCARSTTSLPTAGARVVAAAWRTLHSRTCACRVASLHGGDVVPGTRRPTASSRAAAASHSIAQHIMASTLRAMLCYAMLCCAVLCCAVLCYAMLCCAVLCYAMLCYAMLCYARRPRGHVRRLCEVLRVPAARRADRRRCAVTLRVIYRADRG